MPIYLWSKLLCVSNNYSVNLASLAFGRVGTSAVSEESQSYKTEFSQSCNLVLSLKNIFLSYEVF